MPSHQTRSTRLLWMDVFRGLAVLLVVLLHAQVALVDSQITRSEPVREINAAVGAFRMPGLLLVSGMLLHVSLQRPAGPYLSGKLRRIAWPWLLWTAVMIPFFGLAAAAEPTWWLNGAHTWFLTVVFGCYVLALALKKVPALVTAAALFSLGIWLEPDGLQSSAAVREWLLVADRFAWFGAFFFVGAALGRWRNEVERVPWWAALIPILVLWDRATEAAEAGRYPAEDTWTNAVMSVIGILAVLWVLSRVPAWWPMRALGWVGRHSIVVFVVHYPVIRLLRRVVDPPPGTEGVLIYFAAGAGVSLLLAAAYPWVKWLFEFPKLPARGEKARRRPVASA